MKEPQAPRLPHASRDHIRGAQPDVGIDRTEGVVEAPWSCAGERDVDFELEGQHHLRPQTEPRRIPVDGPQREIAPESIRGTPDWGQDVPPSPEGKARFARERGALMTFSMGCQHSAQRSVFLAPFLNLPSRRYPGDAGIGMPCPGAISEDFVKPRGVRRA